MNADILRRPWPLVAAAALVVGGCGHSDEGAADEGGPWPLAIELPAVLGYLAVGQFGGYLDVADELFSSVGWEPAGID